ncbi:MAG: ATP-grasp domain-containing protein [Spirulinaceae cyanobacterium]
MTCTHEAVVGNHLYSGRVLGMTESQDIIQLHPDLKPEWNTIVEHYQRIGLNHTHEVIWDVSRVKMGDYPDYDISVFFFGDAFGDDHNSQDWFRQADEDWLKVVAFMNSKNNFIKIAQELEVTIPQTICVDSKTKITSYEELPYPCYLKPAVSVDGMGIVRCEDKKELIAAMEFVEGDVPLQIQEEIIASKFLNLQYSIKGEQVQPLAASEQILADCTHMGNRYPTPHQPWEVVEPMAEWMLENGMKEIFAFDVAVVEGENATRYVAIECNPRFNGASYPTGIAQKLNISSWTSENFNTSHRSLKEINLEGIEFDSQSSTGVILVNWGCILVGKVGVLLAGTVEQQDKLRVILQERLG